ncbi:MAG: DUF2846 domain-containing protein [Chitinophagaceae bacterium]|nr:DUF2846 domain-containing protein [Chitinophagaceae bacterium]
MKLILLSIFLLTVTSFAFAQTSDSVASKSKVYFLRNTGYIGSAAAFKTFIDDQFLCRLNNKRYTVHEVPSGKHTFSVQFGGTTLKEKAERFELTLEPGKIYYLRVVFKNGAFVNNVYCEEITENTAKNEIALLKEDTKCE